MQLPGASEHVREGILYTQERGTETHSLSIHLSICPCVSLSYVYPPTPAGAAPVKSRRVVCLFFLRHWLQSWLHRPPPPLPPPPTSPPTVPVVPHSLTAFALTALTSPTAQTAPPVFASPTLPPRPPFHPPSLFRSPQCVPKPLRHRLHPSSCFCFAHRSSSPPASPPHAPTPSVCFVPLRHQCHPSWLR